MISRKHVLATGLILVIVALVALSFRPRPLEVTAAQVIRGPLQVTVAEEGRTRVRDRYQVSAPVSGYAPRQALEVGDPVTAGQVLLRLRPVPPAVLDARSRAEAEARVGRAEAALAAEQSQLRAAEASHALAQRDYRRIQTLFQDARVPRSELERAETEAERAAAALHAARHRVDMYRQELRAARAMLDYSAAQPPADATEEVSIRSPVTGRVLQVHQKSAAIVTSGQALLTVGDPRALEVEVEVLSADAVRLSPGTRVRFERWGGEGRLEGAVRTVEPAGFTKVSALGVEEQRVRVIADIVSPPQTWQALGDAYRVEASFILWEADEVLKAPASALFREGRDWAAFVIEEGVARRRSVRIGQRGELEVEVLEGLAEQETVITHPDDAIEEGVRVEARRQETSAR